MSDNRRREIVIPEVLDAAPRSGMTPLVPPPVGEQPWSLVKCGYCAMHGVTSFHDIENCDEDFGDRWGE